LAQLLLKNWLLVKPIDRTLFQKRIAMDIPNRLVNKVFDYLLRQADAGDTEAEELLDEMNELNESGQADGELKSS
jgi:hypothetical protein